MEQINPQHPVPEMTINAATASEPQLPSKASGSNIELFLAYQIEWLHQLPVTSITDLPGLKCLLSVWAPSLPCY